MAAGEHPLPLAGKNHYPVGPGRVVVFSQDKNRKGNEEHVKKIKEVFGRKGTKVSDCRNFSKDQIVAKLNELREERDEKFCYMMIFILCHGSSESYSITDVRTGEIVKNVNIEFVLDCNDEEVYMHIFEDFVESSYPKQFEHLPRILIGQYCRGSEMVKLNTGNLSLENQVTPQVDATPFQEATEENPRPIWFGQRNDEVTDKNGNFAFLYATLKDCKAVRSSFSFIDEICQVVEKCPELSFIQQMMEVQNKLAEMRITTGGQNFRQIGVVDSALPLPFYLGLHDRKSNSDRY